MTIETSSYSELLAQRAELENKIQAAQAARRAEGIAIVRETLIEYDLTLQDVSGAIKSAGATKTKPAGSNKAPIKYRNDATGQTWSGRGKPPLWIAGKDRAQFLIQDE